MPLPANLSTGTVTGKFTKLNGLADTGTVTFDPEPSHLLDPAGDVIITTTALSVTLDLNGAFTITLPATDDSDVSPVNWTYTVTVATAGSSFAFSMSLPSGTTVNLADVAPAVASGGSVPGITGTGQTYVVAAANAPAVVRARADATCLGTADQATINVYTALGSVQLTDGDYTVSAPITLTEPGSHLYGTGYGEDMGSEGGRGFGTLIKAASGFTGDAVIVVDQANRPAGQSSVVGLKIDGGNFGTSVSGIKMRSYQFTLRDVDVFDMSGDGFEVLGYAAGVPSGAVDWSTYDGRMSGIHAQSCAGAGLYLGVDSADLHLSDCVFNSNNVGIHVAGGSSLQGDNIHVYESTTHGIHFDGVGARTKLDNLKVEHSWQHGIFFDGTNGGQPGVQLSTVGLNCNGKGNAAGTGGVGGGVYSHIAFGGSTGPWTGVVMTNVSCGNSDGVANLAKYCIDSLYSGSQTHSWQLVGGQMGSTVAGGGATTARINYGNAAIRAQCKVTNVRGVWDWAGTVAPVPTASSGAGTSPPTPVLVGTDSAGYVTFGTGTSPSAIQQVTVTYAIPQELSGGGHVQVTPANAATDALGLYALRSDSTTTAFKVSARVAPAASQAATVYAFFYRVDC